MPPTKLHYVSEHRIVKGRNNVYFDCDLFSEKYIEYCFVYVNQAINRAYTNINTNCVPTLPITGGYHCAHIVIIKYLEKQ